jgi:hypothetical protein
MTDAQKNTLIIFFVVDTMMMILAGITAFA